MAASAAAGGHQSGFDSRQEYQYLTLRGYEESSVLVGVRQESGNQLALLDWGRRPESRYNKKSGDEKGIKWIRSMVVKVVLDKNMGFLGNEPNIIVVHVNNVLANAD